jgi:hypothetical protein
VDCSSVEEEMACSDSGEPCIVERGRLFAQGLEVSAWLIISVEHDVKKIATKKEVSPKTLCLGETVSERIKSLGESRPVLNTYSLCLSIRHV